NCWYRSSTTPRSTSISWRPSSNWSARSGCRTTSRRTWAAAPPERRSGVASAGPRAPASGAGAVGAATAALGCAGVLVDQFAHLARALPAALAGAEFGTDLRQGACALADDGADLSVGHRAADADDHGSKRGRSGPAGSAVRNFRNTTNSHSDYTRSAQRARTGTGSGQSGIAMQESPVDGASFATVAPSGSPNRRQPSPSQLHSAMPANRRS